MGILLENLSFPAAFDDAEMLRLRGLRDPPRTGVAEPPALGDVVGMASPSRSWFPTLLVVLVAFAAYKLINRSGSASRLGEKLPPVAVQYLPGSLPYVSGKPAVIEFWATWCPPCRESIPHLNALFARSQGKLQIIGISNEDQTTITAFRKKTPMGYSVASDPSNRLAQHFGVRGIPSAVLVDAAGVVKWTGHPMELDDGKIAMLLR